MPPVDLRESPVMYVELHASSAFSFLSAASLPETLVDRAAALGYPALALLDRDGVYGAPRFHKAARAAGLRPLIGAVLTIAIPDHQIDHQLTSSPHHQLTRFSLPVLVSSPEGWRNLCRLVSRMKLRAPKGEGALVLDELDGHVGGLVALAGQALLAGAAVRRGRAARSAGRHLRPRPRLRRAAAPSAARTGRRQRDAGVPGQRVSRAGGGHRRRAVRVARGAAAVRRAHLHP